MNFDDLESRLEEAFVLESTRNKWRKIALSMGKMTDKQLSKKIQCDRRSHFPGPAETLHRSKKFRKRL